MTAQKFGNRRHDILTDILGQVIKYMIVVFTISVYPGKNIITCGVYIFVIKNYVPPNLNFVYICASENQ